MRRSPGLFSLIFVILLSLAAPWAARGEGGVFAVRGESGAKAPGFALKDLSGAAMSLEDYKGQVVVLHFWASWCEPCKREFPALNRLYSSLKDRGFAVLAVSEDSRKRAAPFVEEHGAAFPVLIDQYGTVMRLYGVKLIPVSVVIDRQGRVRGRLTGETDYAGAQALGYFEALLAE
ncbi:MAG: TlpA family protein disulfide reductase [Deltaproteobacteria bacterium]|nr:TlpA family protein disulfide reductase [Deltaproteobacteria bacterium]